MEEQLLKYLQLKNKALSIEEIKKDLKIESVEGLQQELKKLEISGKIILNKHNNYVLFPSDNTLVQGKLKKDKKGNYFISGQIPVYIDSNLLNGALEEDVVLAVKYDYKIDNKVNGKIQKVIARCNRDFIFEVAIVADNKKMVPIDFELNDEILFNEKDLKNLVEGTRVLVKIEPEKINGKLNGKIFKVIGHKDDPNITMKSVAMSCGADIDFTSESIIEANNMPTSVSEYDKKDRLNLTNETIFTIDSEKAKDIDDAISLKINEKGNYLLGVHIADVAHYIKPGMNLFEEAKKRATSIYALNYVIPMLPHKISNGICSLNEGEERLTKSCIMEIDKQGNVIDYRIVNSIICSNKKMAYKKVNEILDNDEIPVGYENYAENLKLMKELYLILQRKRIKNGSISFDKEELNIHVNKEGKVIDIEPLKRGTSEKIIEQFMILANEIVASNYCYYPFTYRVHNKPNKEKLTEVFEYIKSLNPQIKISKNINDSKVIQNTLVRLKDMPEYPIISDMILKGMAKATYDITNVGHFALASDTYTHFTSPIRRINDLVVHNLIDLYNSLLDDEKLNDLEKKLKAICVNASHKEEQAEKIERIMNDIAIKEFLKDNIGNQFEGTIIYICSKFVLIRLDNGIIGSMTVKKLNNNEFSYKAPTNTLKCRDEELAIGSRLKINVLDPELNNNEIRFNYVKEKEKVLQKVRQILK